MLTKFPQMVWDAEIDATVISLKRHQIKDHDYWFNTVDVVSEGYDPKTRKSITLDGLKAWVDRCKSEPQEDAHDAPSNPRSIHPQN